MSTEAQQSRRIIYSLVRQVNDALAERDALKEKIENSATGIVKKIGDDDDHQPRVLIYSTRSELMKGPSLIYKRVAMVNIE